MKMTINRSPRGKLRKSKKIVMANEKTKYFNFEKSFISVLSIKCLRYCALSGSFRWLEGENAKQDPLCLTVTTVGGLLLNQRFRDHATTRLHRKRNWCRNPENTAETVHSRWALLEVCWYPGHHDGYHRHNEERSKGHTDESSNFQVLHQRRSLAWSRWRLRPETSAKHFSENKTRKTYKT